VVLSRVQSFSLHEYWVSEPSFHKHDRRQFKEENRPEQSMKRNWSNVEYEVRAIEWDVFTELEGEDV
jgi:hypothetical protein